MPRKNSNPVPVDGGAQSAVSVLEREPEPAFEPTAEPNVPLTREEEQAAVMRLADPNLGLIVAVRCTVPGYEHLTVHFAVDNQYRVARLFREMPRDISNEAFGRILALFIRRIDGWRFVDEDGAPVPVPTPSDPLTYGVIFDRYLSLYRWLRVDGYAKAKEEALKN